MPPKCKKCGHDYHRDTCEEAARRRGDTYPSCIHCGRYTHNCICTDNPEATEAGVTTLPLTIYGVPYDKIARDLFIAAAVAGLLAAPDTDFGYDELAKRAILQADAVMKARAR